ncbi:hypothetical protein SAY86_014077 [Trapa natans]|uniref:HMA domain-containing protein n=1 Tax=Trapa natans TaxID=22666 RepID=A0AAN7KS27_TRANT|nr:hypothetical protein SAY86_014077 [Trapa natans]
MKGMDLFCASPASTVICTGSDGRSMIRHGGRPMDPHSPRSHHHHLPRRTQPHVPCSSHLMPIIPRPYSEKSISSSSRKLDGSARRRSSADTCDPKSPPGSSRFLLSDAAFADLISETSDHKYLSALVPVGQPTMKPTRHSVPSCESPSLRSSHSVRAQDQVVVLRVSLHCKGCESKLKKHLAKMEGVTSYSIDMEIKKVTIRGDITPLGVLSSISRVKYAQLWPVPAPSSALQFPSRSA